MDHHSTPDLPSGVGPQQQKNEHNHTSIVRDDGDDDDSDSDERYNEFFQSIRTKTGLEIGLRVSWPKVPPFELSTCLSPKEIAPMFDGTQWAGTRVWRAAIVTLQYMLLSWEQQRQQDHCSGDETKQPIPILVKSNHRNKTKEQDEETTTILELGCGLGVPGILLGLLIQDCHVVLTDKESLREQLHQNLERLFDDNNKNHTKNSSSTTTLPQQQQQQQATMTLPKRKRNIQAASLDWSVEGVTSLVHSLGRQQQQQGFDVVLNCDCIYEPLYGTSWRKLWECQEELLRLNQNTYMLTAVERRRMDGVDSYLALVEKSTIVERVELVEIPFDHPREVEICRIYGKDRR